MRIIHRTSLIALVLALAACSSPQVVPSPPSAAPSPTVSNSPSVEATATPEPTEAPAGASIEHSGLTVLDVSEGHVTISTNIDIATGESEEDHEFDLPGDTHLAQQRVPLYRGDIVHSPLFDAVAVVTQAPSETEPATAGWVTDDGQLVSVSDMVVDSDGFAEPPYVGWPQFDATGNFYFGVDNGDKVDVYRTAYKPGGEQPDMPKKVKAVGPLEKGFGGGYAEDVLVWADGRVTTLSRLKYPFIAAPGQPKRGSWNHSAGMFGFLGKGWVGVSEGRVAQFQLEPNTEKGRWSNLVVQRYLSARTKLTFGDTGGVSPDESTIAFLAGREASAPACNLYVMKPGESPEELLPRTCQVAKEYRVILGWT